MATRGRGTLMETRSRGSSKWRGLFDIGLCLVWSCTKTRRTSSEIGLSSFIRSTNKKRKLFFRKITFMNKSLEDPYNKILRWIYSKNIQFILKNGSDFITQGIFVHPDELGQKTNLNLSICSCRVWLINITLK